MKDLYERLVELLGKPRPTSAEPLVNLINDFKQKPLVDCSHDRIWTYSFPQSGIELIFDTRTGMFWKLTLRIASREGKSEKFKPFDGSLPFGITRLDSRDTVEVKLPGGTMEIKDYRYDVDLRPLIVIFHYQAPDPIAPGVGEEKLTMVTVDYTSPSLKGLCRETA